MKTYTKPYFLRMAYADLPQVVRDQVAESETNGVAWRKVSPKGLTLEYKLEHPRGGFVAFFTGAGFRK